MNGKEIIKELYEAEESHMYHAAQEQSVSFKVSVDTASMLAAIAERFETSRHALGGDILDTMTLQMFAGLTPEDRAILAEKADKMTDEYMVKKGFTNESFGMGHEGKEKNRFGKWRMYLAVDELEKQEQETDK